MAHVVKELHAADRDVSGLPRRGRRRLALAAGALVLSLAGCQGSGGHQARRQPTAPPAAQSKEHSVPLVVERGGNGAVIALVPIHILGKGPYPFALDTGASQSVIGQHVAQELRLATAGVTGPISGVFLTERADLVKVPQWRVGDVHLPAATVMSLPLRHKSESDGLAGLLGSDMLSHFGAVTIEYERQLLILRFRRH